MYATRIMTTYLCVPKSLDFRLKLGINNLAIPIKFTRQTGGLRGGRGVPDVPVPGVLLEGRDDAVEIGQLVQLRDVVPRPIHQPLGTRVVHLVVSVHNL